MNGINNNNMPGHIHANIADLNTVPHTTQVSSGLADAYGYEWFVLPTGDAAPNRAIVAEKSTLEESIDSRVERIIQYILPRD